MFEHAHRHAHLWPGVPLALASAVLFGASAPFAKLLLGSVDPQALAGLLYLGAGVGLAAVHGSRSALRIEAPEAPLRRSDAPWLLAVVLFGGVAGPLLLMLGLARTSAASGSLLLNLEGLATMGIAWVVFRENVDRRLLLGAAAILAGAVRAVVARPRRPSRRGRRPDRAGLPRLGRRQQPDPQAVLRRSGRDRVDQGARSPGAPTSPWPSHAVPACRRPA